jgi:hypothetical protein
MTKIISVNHFNSSSEINNGIIEVNTLSSPDEETKKPCRAGV